MAKRINTGWRVVEPGACSECGCDSDYGCNGRGEVICSCNPEFDESFDSTEADGDTDLDISRGFDAGNYAAAYQTQDYQYALGCLSPNRSAAYIAAFTLGFFSSFDIDEMGEYSYEYEQAYASVGARALQLGIAVPEEGDRSGELLEA